jgi:hypothetical protein
MNTFYFSSISAYLEDNINIFDNIESLENNVLYNRKYKFRLPHDKLNDETVEKYKRRKDRFLNYKNMDDKYLFIRIINLHGAYQDTYGKNAESLNLEYSEENYNKLTNFLPINSKILLIAITKKLSKKEKESIYEKFIVLDEAIPPHYCFYGSQMDKKEKIVNCYNNLFEYVENNFYDINKDLLQDFIHNSKIAI